MNLLTLDWLNITVFWSSFKFFRSTFHVILVSWRLFRCHRRWFFLRIFFDLLRIILFFRNWRILLRRWFLNWFGRLFFNWFRRLFLKWFSRLFFNLFWRLLWGINLRLLWIFLHYLLKFLSSFLYSLLFHWLSWIFLLWRINFGLNLFFLSVLE